MCIHFWNIRLQRIGFSINSHICFFFFNPFRFGLWFFPLLYYAVRNLESNYAFHKYKIQFVLGILRYQFCFTDSILLKNSCVTEIEFIFQICCWNGLYLNKSSSVIPLANCVPPKKPHKQAQQKKTQAQSKQNPQKTKHCNSGFLKAIICNMLIC